MANVDPTQTGFITFESFLDFMTRECSDEDSVDQLAMAFKTLSGDKVTLDRRHSTHASLFFSSSSLTSPRNYWSENCRLSKRNGVCNEWKPMQAWTAYRARTIIRHFHRRCTANRIFNLRLYFLTFLFSIFSFSPFTWRMNAPMSLSTTIARNKKNNNQQRSSYPSSSSSVLFCSILFECSFVL